MWHILLLEAWMANIPPPPFLLLKNGVSFKNSLHLLVWIGNIILVEMGLGGGLEGGITFFWHSWEENSYINHWGWGLKWERQSRGISPDTQNSSVLQLSANSLAELCLESLCVCITVLIISQQKTAVYITNGSTLKKKKNNSGVSPYKHQMCTVVSPWVCPVFQHHCSGI